MMNQKERTTDSNKAAEIVAKILQQYKDKVFIGQDEQEGENGETVYVIEWRYKYRFADAINELMDCEYRDELAEVVKELTRYNEDFYADEWRAIRRLAKIMYKQTTDIDTDKRFEGLFN